MVTSAKDSRIEIRASLETKAQLQEAAALSGQDLSSFILDAASAKARGVLLEGTLIRLSDADLDVLEAALDSPPDPSPALVELFRKHRNS
ncbi:MAG: DUF1778 domain-containing protein [Ancrocorticia sp.]|uniref:type II toxin-antitoxin system TacA family antitoxin n=1 Tax=Ancrocorticia sp. TaxID=2593684 RepID=UPI003F93D0AB